MRTYVSLSELDPFDQQRIRELMYQERHNVSKFLYDHEYVGQRIWRPVYVIPFGSKLIKEPWDDLLIQDSQTKAHHTPVKVFRAWRRGDGEWVAKDADSRGMVCLCFDPIPKDWTYFQIQKVHSTGRSMVVSPVEGDKQELFRMF